MADKIEVENFRRHQNSRCSACEQMLTDALDGTLTFVDQAWFDSHLAGCATCSQMFADATRGAAWLEMLKTPRPEPSAALLERILAQTDLADAQPALYTSLAEAVLPSTFAPASPALVSVTLPVTQPANLLAFRPRTPRLVHAFFEPRLAMTAAMAFFSIALTLNLTGVRLDQMHASSLKPANLQRTYYQANASAVRYYDNLRVVHVLESRVDDVRQANGMDEAADRSESGDRTHPLRGAQQEQTAPARPVPTAPAPAPAQPDSAKPQQENKPADGQGSSRRESPLSQHHSLLASDTRRRARPEQVPLLQGGLA